MTLTDQRHLFDIVDGVAYFNTASLSPMLHTAREAGERALARRTMPWQIAAEDWFENVERLRRRVATLLGVSAEGVALVASTSYGLGIAAQNIETEPGDRVLVLAGEFPSNYYTWQRFARERSVDLVEVAREEGESWADSIVRSIDERTRVVAVPNVHWTDGALVDLGAVSKAVRRTEALLAVDATQSLGAMPLDINTVQPDFVVAAGYKWLLGTLGVSYLYVAEEYRDGRPLEENWINRTGSDDFAAVSDYVDAYRPGARRFDVGQHSDLVSVAMALAAVDQVLEWGVVNIATTLAEITAEIARRATELGFRVPAEETRAPHMLGVELPRQVANEVPAALTERGVAAAVRGPALRIAPHLHVTKEDVERLLEVLGQCR